MLAGVALPAIGLVVGAIVIMNIMLVAVAERTHEIGLLRAIELPRRGNDLHAGPGRERIDLALTTNQRGIRS